MAIIASVVSIPPNSSTPAFDATSGRVRAPASPATAATSDVAGSRSNAGSMDATSSANASAPVRPESRPAVISVTAATMASYQPSAAAGSVSSSPSACTIATTESGPARSRRRSARPRASTASSSPSTSRSTISVNRAPTAASRNGRANGSRCRACSAPSSESMLGPTTSAVEKRGSSTVKVSGSRITRSARSRLVTSQPSSAGSHDTGSLARSRWRSGCGSRSSASTVADAPIGNDTERRSVVTVLQLPRTAATAPSRGRRSAHPGCRARHQSGRGRTVWQRPSRRGCRHG